MTEGKPWPRTHCTPMPQTLHVSVNEEKRGLVPAGAYALYTLGAVAALGGIIGLAVSGSNFRARKRQLRKLEEAGYVGLRRVQWDVTRSGLVF